MKKMNLPNKITVCRLILAAITLIIMVFPWEQVNVKWPIYALSNTEISLKYIICGICFMVGSFTDFLDGNIARKRNMVTDFGKVMDAIADKVLVNGVLIILAYDRVLPIIVPVIIITRDTVVDSIKMIAGKKSGKAVPASIAGKIKTVCMMVGVTFVFYSNLPFSLFNLPVGNILVYIACILSVYSGIEYYLNNKESFSDYS